MQLTTDMGSKVNLMHQIQETLRDEVAPELVPPQYPHGVKQSITNNTPIESFWRWLWDGDGHSTKITLQEGAVTGISLPHNDIHRQTFYWLWVPLIQGGLDRFREYWNNLRHSTSAGHPRVIASLPVGNLTRGFEYSWPRNNHRLQKSKGKLNASGSSPLNMLINPTSVVATALNCSIKVNPETVYHLQEAHGGQEARDEAFWFTSREFEADADAVYVNMGCPELNLTTTAWGVFQQVVAELESCYSIQ
ncbi:hypothetical protein DFH06DRAFT_1349786 [Mycena polygramma]|nr:hypothetical protein DFH06DRAFT_1349786 [Mycena polygramma]